MTKQEHELQAQKELIENLKAEIKEYWSDVSPDQWDKQRGYITTAECAGPCNESVTTGVDYVVLTEDEIASRNSGDYLDDSPWEIVTQEEFTHNVLVYAKEILVSMKEENTQSKKDASWDMAEHCREYVKVALNV